MQASLFSLGFGQKTSQTTLAELEAAAAARASQEAAAIKQVREEKARAWAAASTCAQRQPTQPCRSKGAIKKRKQRAKAKAKTMAKAAPRERSAVDQTKAREH